MQTHCTMVSKIIFNVNHFWKEKKYEKVAIIQILIQRNTSKYFIGSKYVALYTFMTFFKIAAATLENDDLKKQI